jgi:hypothetical protein
LQAKAQTRLRRNFHLLAVSGQLQASSRSTAGERANARASAATGQTPDNGSGNSTNAGSDRRFFATALAFFVVNGGIDIIAPAVMLKPDQADLQFTAALDSARAFGFGQ